MSSSFYLKDKTKSLKNLPAGLKEKLEPYTTSYGYFCGSLSISTDELISLSKELDRSNEIKLENLKFNGYRSNIDLENVQFENCSFTNEWSGSNFTDSSFKKCSFEYFTIANPSSMKNASFGDCNFKSSLMTTYNQNIDLTSIEWSGEEPTNENFKLYSNFNNIPEWYLNKINVEIYVDNISEFSSEEKKILSIDENANDDDGEWLLSCNKNKLTPELLKKIFNNIATECCASSFDGVDFRSFTFPKNIDFSSVSFNDCNLQDATFLGSPNFDCASFARAKIAGCNFGKSKNLDTSDAILTRDNSTKDKKMATSSNSATTFSADQLKAISNYSAAAPAVANMFRKSVKRLLQFLLTKSGKSKSMINSYVKVAMDLLENFKEEANQLFQLVIGYICANLHKVGDMLGVDEKSVLRFFSSKKVQAFGEFCIANGKGSVIASLLKKATDIGESLVGQLFMNPDFQRIAEVIENPETAVRVSELNEEETETEEMEEAAPAKKSRKHA